MYRLLMMPVLALSVTTAAAQTPATPKPAARTSVARATKQPLVEFEMMTWPEVKAALAAGLTPIVCVGETLAEREGNHTDAVLQRQFESSHLFF